MKIAYLNPDCVNDLEYEGEKERQQTVVNHEETKFYSPEDFAKQFNMGFLSDEGLIAIVDDNYKLISRL